MGTTLGSGSPERIVIVGAGFSGFFAARHLGRLLGLPHAQITMVTDVDGMLYQPLLPDVAVGLLEPRTILVPLTTTLPRVHLVRGRATALDADDRVLTVTGLEGKVQRLGYDRLLLAAGSVSRLRDIPGLDEYAIGFKTTGQALYLRDLLLRRMELANDEHDPATRKALLTFIVVGAGYAGTELAAQMSRTAKRLAARFPGLQAGDLRWMLLDMAPNVMPELGDDLGLLALKVLRRRGVDVRLNTSVEQMTSAGTRLTDGTWLPGAVVVWCAGVTPNPLVAETGLPVVRGRFAVDTDLRVTGRSNIYAAGDAAAVPDISRPRQDDGNWPLCPPTAQHAMRQGSAVARNIAADVLGRSRRPYRHRDLGLVVDLGGLQGVARPLGVPLHGPAAKIVTRAYHVAALPTMRRRLRAVAGWGLAGRDADDVSLGLAMPDSVLARAEHRSASAELPNDPRDVG